MMNIHELPWRMGCSRGNTSSTRWKNHQLPDASSVSPSSPSSWRAQCKLGLEEWGTHSFTVLMFSANCPFNQIQKRGDIGDTKWYTIWWSIYAGSNQQLDCSRCRTKCTYPYIFSNLMTRIYWCFLDWTHELQHVAIYQINFALEVWTF
jgi:hypothetical protein